MSLENQELEKDVMKELATLRKQVETLQKKYDIALAKLAAISMRELPTIRLTKDDAIRTHDRIIREQIKDGG